MLPPTYIGETDCVAANSCGRHGLLLLPTDVRDADKQAGEEVGRPSGGVPGWSQGCNGEANQGPSGCPPGQALTQVP